MILVILTALAAVCGAAKLDTSYLPPISARTAGGSPGALVAPLDGSSQGPTGSYTNEVQGVVVDAVNPGTRTSGLEPTGLGGPRTSYGSTNSKVGDAAFRGPIAGLESPGPLTRIAPGFGSFVESDDAQADNTNKLKFTSDVGLDNYSYGFETDNGISVGENGEAADGVKAQGGYSYKGNDGKTYSVSYTADEGGYKPQGQHLPTPPPIPSEILISLEKNAKEEAAGHVDDGSYDAQKYNDGGDYSSNGAGSNNGGSSIDGGVATTGGSYVSQSGQAQRPTSGVLVGTYKPGSVVSHSSQEHSAQGFAQDSGNMQSVLGLNKVQSGSQGLGLTGGSSSIGGQFGQASSKGSNSLSYSSSSQGSQSGITSQSTENRFGVQSSKSEGAHAQAHASVAGSPVRSPGFQNGASAYSSVVSSGSGSASAFASTGPLSSGLKNEHNHYSNSFGSAGQHAHGSDSSAGASFNAPATATASASTSGQTQPGFHTHGQSPSSASASASVSGNQHNHGHLTQQVPSRFGEGQKTGSIATTGEYLPPVSTIGSAGKPQVSAASSAHAVPLSHQSSQTQFSGSNTQVSGAKPTPAASLSSSQVGSIGATYASSTQKPFISQQQGSDDSYYYKQPSKPFVIPTAVPNSQANKGQPNNPISFISQQGSKYPNTPISSATGQYQGTGSSSYNGITQAAISPFPSDSSSSSTQFASQSSQFGSKPSTQFGQSSQQTTTQFGSTETHSGHKPIVQSQTQFGQSPTSQNSGSSQSSTQQYQGTIYQYNKPATTLPVANSQAKPGQIETDSRFGTQQSSSQYGSQSTFQQTQTGSNVQTSQFGQKPIVNSKVTGSNYQFGSSGSQFGQKPLTTQGFIVSSNTNTQSQTSFGQKPVGNSQTTTQFGPTGLEFGSKPQTTQGSSFTYSQSQTSQFGKKPVSTTQTGITSQQTQFGSTGFQFGQNSQTTGSSVSTTIKPSFGQKPLGQQTQFGSSSSQFSQNVQSSVGAGSVSTTSKPSFGSYQQSQFSSKPQTTQGSSFAYTQSQTSQFEKKPISTQTGTQQSQFGSTGFQFGQNSQSTQGSGLVSTTVKPTYVQKPFGSANQQTQFGYAGSQFGSKPETTQGSSFTYSQATSQTSHFGKKPVSTTNTGVTSQQTQFGSSGSQFGQNSQSTFGSGSISTTAKPSFSQKPFGSSNQQTQFASQFGQNSQSIQGTVSTTTPKPFGSSYQQTQFGTAVSQFGSKPPTTQGSSFTYGQSQTSQYGKKPVSTIQTGVTSQQTQFGSSGSQFGQNSQSTFGSGSVLTTAKPSFGSSYQQTQLGSKPQTTQSSSFTYGQSQTSQYGKKPVSTIQTGVTSQQTQFGSSGSQFGQNSQSTFGSGSVSTTAKPSFGSSYQQTQFGSKPQTIQGSSFTYGQSQTSQYGKKPVSTTQTGVTSQATQFGSSGSQFGQNSQFGSSGSQFGQNSQSFVGTGSASTTAKPSVGSYQQTQYGSKPQTTQSSSFTHGQSQTSQYGKKPVGTTQTGVTSQKTQFGSSGSQFGQNSQFGSSGSQFGQNSQSFVGTGSVSTTAKPSIGSYQQTQYGLKPQTTQGSSFTYSQASSQSSQFGKKPIITTTQTGTQQSQFGLTGFQSGQNSQSNQGSGVVSTTVKPSYGQKPIGSSYQQTQFGSTGSGSQFGQNSLSNQGSGLTSTVSQTSISKKPVYQQTQFGSSGSQFSQGQTSQFGKKPVSTTQTGVTTQQTQFGSSGTQFGQNSQFGSSGTQFGQNSQTTVGTGSVSTSTKPSFGSYQQTQYGSKPQITQGSSFTYSQASSQSSQFGKQPSVSTTQTGVTSQQSQLGLSNSQFGQNSQSAQGSAVPLSTSKPVTGAKPVYQQAQFGSSGSQFSQNSQSTQGSGLVSTTSKPSFGQTSFGSSSQFGSSGPQYGQKPQITPGSSFTSNTYSQSQTSQFAKKPETSQTGSAFQQTQFGSTGQKPVTTQVTGATSTIGQASFGQKPSTTAGSFYQQSQFGSTGSQFVQKPQSATQGSSFTSNTDSKGEAVQTSQFGITGSSQNVGLSSQSTQFGSLTGPQYGQKPQVSQGTVGINGVQSGNKISGSSSASGSSFQQTQFAGSSGSQFGQVSQGTVSQAQPVQTIQYGIKPFSSSQNTQGSTQFGLTASRFGESSQTVVPTITTISQTVQPTPFAQKPIQTPFGSSAAHFGQKPPAHASAFASSSGSNVVPFGSTQTISKYQQNSQLGAQNQGVVSTTQKPIVSFLSQTNNQQYQYTQTANKFGSQSQFGQGAQSNVGSGQIGQTTFGAQSQKPFGSQSTQTTYQQTQYTQGQKPFGSSQGSAFQIGQSAVDQPTQGTVQTSNSAGYNYQKPQPVFTAQYVGQGNGPQDQKVQQTQSNYNSAVSTSQTPINGEPITPFGISSTQGTFQQTQSTVGTSQFGAQPAKPTDFSGPVIQTSYNQFSGKPFQPASTVSTQVSNIQSQSSAVSNSQFGLQQPTKPTEIEHFSGQPFQSSSTHGSGHGSYSVVGSTPEYSVHTSEGIVLSTHQGVFSSTQAPSVPSRLGSNEGLVVSTVQTPIVPVPGYEIVTSNHGASHGFVGLGEQFAGPRDPPRFDDKTGYHY